MEELKSIIQQMINNGESEEDIQAVIGEWDKRNPGLLTTTEPTEDDTPVEDDGANFLIDRIADIERGTVEPEDEDIVDKKEGVDTYRRDDISDDQRMIKDLSKDKNKYDNFFTEVIPAKVDVTKTPIVESNFNKLTVDKESIANFLSDENLGEINKAFEGTGVDIKRFRNNVVVKLPGMNSSRSFPVPSEEQGLDKLKYDIANYVGNWAPSGHAIDPESGLDIAIDNVWDKHSHKWNAEDLMRDELGEILGSDYELEPGGSFGNEFTVKRVSDGDEMNIRVGGSDKAGWANTPDELKAFITRRTPQFEDTPEFKEERKELTKGIVKNYLKDPTNLNRIFERADITSFSNIATPKNKKVLIDNIMSDISKNGNWLDNARVNFDNLTNVDIDEIVHGVISSDVYADWAKLASKDADKEINEQLVELKTNRGLTDSEAHDEIHNTFVKQHSANFTTIEDAIKEINLLIDKENELGELKDEEKIKQLNRDLKPIVDKYKLSDKYNVLFDTNTGELASGVIDPKSPGIIDLTEGMVESMGNYQGLSRADLKEEFIKTSAALKEWEDKVRTSKFRPRMEVLGYGKSGSAIYGYKNSLRNSDEWKVMAEQKAELLKKLEGLKRTYLLNERIETIDKSDWSGWWEQAGRSFYTSLGPDENTAIINNGVTEAQAVAAVKDLYSEFDISLSRAAKEHSKVNTADMIAMGAGSTPRIVGEFMAFGAGVNAVKTLVGINKWVQMLGKSRFRKGNVYLSEKVVTKEANRWANRRGLSVTPQNQQKIIGSYTASKGVNISIEAPSLINRAKITSVGAISEGLVFTGVERDIEGMPKGIGFNLAGKFIPPALQTQLTYLNTLYKLSAGGARMAIGNQAGTAFNGIVKNALGHEDWQVFLKNNYDDPDAVMGHIITDLVLGGALAGMHMSWLDVRSHSGIKKAMGEFDTKRRKYVDERGNVKEGEQANFDKWNDLYNAAKHRVYQNEGIQDYLNPLKAASMAKREAEKVGEDLKGTVYKGVEVNGMDVSFKKPGKKERKGEVVFDKKTGKFKVELDPETITPGLVAHELHHPLYMMMMENKPAKAESIRKLLDVTKKVQLREGFTLYDAIKQKGVEATAIEGMDLAKVREAELFAYISETLRNGAHYDGIKNSNGWWRLKKWIQGDTKAIINNRTMNDIVNWFGEYHQNIGGGKSNLSHFKKLAELVENMEPGAEPTITEPGVRAPLIEGIGTGSYVKFNTYKNEVGLGSERLIDSQGNPVAIKVTEEDKNKFNKELQKLAVKPLDAKTIKDIKKKKAIDTSKLPEKGKEQLEKDILDLEAGTDVYKVIEMYDPSVNKTAGTGRVINKMASRSKTPGWDIIKDDVLREFLTGPRGIKGLTADYNRKVREGDINPETFPLGKFIGGKFDVRFQGVVENLQSKKFTKQVGGETTPELKAEIDPMLEKLDVMDLSPRAQLERKKWLEERGLTEETAETYVAKQDLMTLSKELGLKGNIVEKSQTTIPELKRNMEPQRPGESKKEYNKRIVSHKNAIHQYRKTIEKDLLTNFWGISKTTADKMSTVEEVDGQIVSKKGQALKTAQAWQLKGTENKPGDLQAVKNKVEETETKTIDGKEVEVYKNVPTILTAISKGAQDKIDPVDMTNVAPDIVRGKSAGVPKTLLLLGNELLFTPTSKRAQTAEGLAPFIQSEAFIKYQKTTNQAYKTEFEQKFVESLKTPQHYKAVMQEVGKNIYLQSVRSALPKESALARQLEAGKNEGLASERLFIDQIQKDLRKGKVKPSLNDFDTLFKTPEYKKFREEGLTDAWLNKVAKIEDAGKAGIADPTKVGEIMAEGTPRPDVKMEAIEAKDFKEMVGKLISSFGKKAKQLFHNIKTGEGLDSFSKDPVERAVQNKVDAAIMNYYPTGSQSILVKNAGNGKNENWNFATEKFERIKYDPAKENTLQNWADHNLGGEVIKGNGKNIKDAEYWFLRESIVKNTGDVKTDLANEVIAAYNRGESLQKIVEIVHTRGREMMTNGKPENFNRVVEANRLKRQFHMDAMKHVIENHADYGLTLQQAVQGALRHVRRHTNITDGSLKGTATITAGSIEVGIPVGKNIDAKNYLGTMYHAEHQLQLQNLAYTFFDSLGRNWNGKTKKFNTTKFKEEMDVLNELFEQSTPVKQDQMIYDSSLFGGRTAYLKTFGNKNLGEVSSILNILYRPGVAETMVDFKSEVPQTIAETILQNYTHKQIGELLRISSKLGKPNSLHASLSARNTPGQRKVEANKTKLIENVVGKGSTKGLGSDKIDKAARAVDKAVAEGRKRNKKKKSGSFFDADDTLFSSKSGVRARVPNPSGKPKPGRKVIFLAGGAGSGKSNVVRQLGLERDGFKIVNSDISLEWLKKNSGLPADMKDLTPKQLSQLGKLQWEARKIAARKQMKFQGKGDGIVVDGTGGSAKVMQKQVAEFRDKGYDVQMMFVETSLETALKRNAARKERTLKESIVRKNHEAVQNNKETFRELFGDNFAEVKTDNLKLNDPMPSELVSKMGAFTKGYENRRLTAEEFAMEGSEILTKGGKFDFSEFNKVVEGETGFLFPKALAKAKKYGNKDMFIITARPPAAAKPIHDFLKSQGLNIPLKNIYALGNSTPEAKALKIAEKIGEGYNDIYFADDVLANVQAVKNIMDQFDVKGKVQQALASERLDTDINTIMEHSLGVESGKRFSKAEGKARGKDVKRRRIFMPDSASDLELLIEPLFGKGKEGVKNKKWFEKNFLKPWERGVNDLNTARQTILNDFMSLRKQNKDVVKQLDKAVEGTNFTLDQAMRVYIWNKNGFKIPDLTKTSEAKLVEYIKNNPKLQNYADQIARLTKIETGLKEPSAEWWAETLASEVSETGRTIDRAKYIADWVAAKNEIFSEVNLNKMESRLGTRWRESIEDMLDRMETGRTRGRDMGRIGNQIMNYLNGSVGAIMNLNTRSATLQLISTVNFINHAENNPFAATRAFLNQPQYWRDFLHIMNSDMLVQRRAGLKINVTEAELAAAAEGKGNKAKKALAWILKQGYIPTKVADSFAISAGGATYYRNRIRMYEKQGLEAKEAERKAWEDFQAIAERTQQSSRADLLSKQQTSFEGRLILPFANTPLQMNRIMMKEMLDLSKGRYKGSFGENSFTNKMSKIAYYGAIQSLIFAGLQSGLFALMANSDDEEMIAQKKVRTVNTMTDSFLRGMGIQGAVVSGVKNSILKFLEQNEKGYKADYDEVGEALLNISPTIGSKVSKLDAAGNTYSYNKKEIQEKGLSLDNTKAIEASAQTVEAITNVPVYRAIRKTQNIQGALDKQNEAWQRLMMLLGWSKWDVGIKEEKKKKKKKKKKKTIKITF